MGRILNFEEFLNEKWTVGGTESNKIILFDVDDTLLTSDVKVLVKVNGEVVQKLTPAQFNFYKPKKDDELDFSEFTTIDGLRKGKFTKYWETLKREYKKGTHIGILTARSNKDMFKPFFYENGIDIKNDLIFAVNDPSVPYTGSIEERKSQVIEQLINYGYRLFIFFDDNKNNLKMAKDLEKKYPIKVKTVAV